MQHQQYPSRQYIRLKEYDYAQAGLYFITICTHNRKCLFGNVADGKMVLNDAGKMIETQWQELTKRFPNIVLHQYVVMPNHVHGIIQIVGTAPVGAALVAARNNSPENPVGAPLVGAHENNDANIQAPLVGDHENTVANNNVVQNNNRATTRVAPTDITGDNNGAATRAAPTTINTINKTIGDMMDAFKSITTVEYIRGVKNSGWPPFNAKIWQRSYHDHIIRNQQSYVNISEYIINNPMKWKDDKFYRK